MSTDEIQSDVESVDVESDELGIPPYRPERDDELAYEAHLDDMLQTADEPILGRGTEAGL